MLTELFSFHQQKVLQWAEPVRCYGSSSSLDYEEDDDDDDDGRGEILQFDAGEGTI